MRSISPARPSVSLDDVESGLVELLPHPVHRPPVGGGDGMAESLDSWSLKEAKQQPAIGPDDAFKLSEGSLNGVRGSGGSVHTSRGPRPGFQVRRPGARCIQKHGVSTRSQRCSCSSEYPSTEKHEAGEHWRLTYTCYLQVSNVELQACVVTVMRVESRAALM